MNNLYVNETWINASEHYRSGESEPYESFTDNLGELYRALVKEHGRCVGKMYVDRTDGTQIQTGWVFQKRRKYDDVNETYLAETWVTVYKSEPIKEITVKSEYAWEDQQ